MHEDDRRLARTIRVLDLFRLVIGDVSHASHSSTTRSLDGGAPTACCPERVISHNGVNSPTDVIWSRASEVGIVAAMFDDLLDANRRYQASFSLQGLEPRARRGLAVVTCMDSRIEPLAMLGLEPGDAKIFRNAGARVTEDVLRSLVLAVHLLGVDRICVVQHTSYAMTKYSDTEFAAVVTERAGADASHGISSRSTISVRCSPTTSIGFGPAR